ncbi:hypothetical protein KNE206_16870 [Kitasatospora sp. NE20-6]|uniref:hypothetical protein n=1 Tax=Kitasatospora sp. NE20-6 TaxID=2859066 RepID=UPI0034DC044F
MAALPYAFRALSSALPSTRRWAAVTGAGIALPLLLAAPAPAGQAGTPPGLHTPGRTVPHEVHEAVEGAVQQAASALPGPGATTAGAAGHGVPDPGVPDPAAPGTGLPDGIPGLGLPGPFSSPSGGSGMSGLPSGPRPHSPATVPEPDSGPGQGPAQQPGSGPSAGAAQQPAEEPADAGAGAAEAPAEEPCDDEAAASTAPAAPSSAAAVATTVAVRPKAAHSAAGPHDRSGSAAALDRHGPAPAAETPAAVLPDGPGASGTSGTPAEEPAATVAADAVPPAATGLAAPLRWSDASTRQLPLGAGLTLIGCGLALVGLRLRRG